MSDIHGERIAVLEATAKDLGRRIIGLEENNTLLTEMKVLMELQTNMNIQQNNQMKDFSNVLGNVNTNLTKLNISQDQLKTDITEIGDRVEDIEKNSDKYKIDVPKLITKILIGIAMIIPSVVGAWLLIQMGLK